MSDEPTPSAFRSVPRTGVIYVTTEASKRGFRTGDPAWCNLGQGQPETGPLPGAPARVEQIAIDVDDQEYAPIPGIPELREAIADLYNRHYRRGMPSQYSAENVSVSGGGRAALTRAAASLRREIHGRGLGALLLSNPCNPTGKHVRGDELASWVALARELDCALLLDEL